MTNKTKKIVIFRKPAHAWVAGANYQFKSKAARESFISEHSCNQLFGNIIGTKTFTVSVPIGRNEGSEMSRVDDITIDDKVPDIIHSLKWFDADEWKFFDIVETVDVKVAHEFERGKTYILKDVHGFENHCLGNNKLVDIIGKSPFVVSKFTRGSDNVYEIRDTDGKHISLASTPNDYWFSQREAKYFYEVIEDKPVVVSTDKSGITREELEALVERYEITLLSTGTSTAINVRTADHLITIAHEELNIKKHNMPIDEEIKELEAKIQTLKARRR